jgi:serine/threonine-protein kinase
MGEVWRATDQVLGREVALKVLKPEYSDDPTFRSRFETEARNAAALHHPNVASVFDFGDLPADEASGKPRPYLVMELVRGEPLSALLRHGERMPPDVAANLLAQAADGLAAAHELGIVHRDVKPANLLVTRDRTVKITDFGIARAADAVALTTTGQVIGTPQYLSPEQAEGKRATGASDIYSLGVVLYECLAGRRPFDADSPIATALSHIRDEPPPLPDDVPDRLRRTVETALAKDPADRFASVADFAAALRGGPVPEGTRTAPAMAAVEGHDDRTRRLAPTPTDEDRPDSRRRRGVPAWVVWVGAAIAVALIVVLLARLSAKNHNNDASSGSPTDRPTSSAPPTTTSGPSQPTQAPAETVTVNRSDYVGQPAKDAKKRLHSLGLKVNEQQVDNPGDKPPDTVADVNPTGEVKKGSTVTLSVYGKPTPTPQPTQSPSGSSSAPSGGGNGNGNGNGGGNGSSGGVTLSPGGGQQ